MQMFNHLKLNIMETFIVNFIVKSGMLQKNGRSTGFTVFFFQEPIYRKNYFFS